MRFHFVLFVLFFGLVLSGCENAREAVTPPPITDDPYSNLKNALCDKQVALLGEGNSHDEGATIEFKSRIIVDLVKECGFSLIVFESSFYEFINLNRIRAAGKQLSREEIDASIGWMWRNQVEIQPLLKFLHKAANDGQVTIAGMDDQISGRGQDYANLELPIELTEELEILRQEKCREALNKQIYHAYSDGVRYDAAKKAFILSCLGVSGNSEDKQLAVMRASLIRDFQRDHLGGKAHYTGRASSMYKNFEYWFENHEKPKTIIWSATVHAAKVGRLSPSFGELVQSRFGDDAYTLGFSALSGTRGRPGRDKTTLPDVPEEAVEAIVFKGIEDDIVFVNSEALTAFGTAPAAALSNRYETRDWAAELDGLIVFREQKPLTLMQAPTE